MTPTRRSALAAGLLYLATIVSSIPALALIQPILTQPEYVLGDGPQTRVVFGIVLDLVNVAAASDGGFEALAVLQSSSLEAGEIHLGAVDGPRLTVLELPSREEAIAWATRIAKACRCDQELRVFQFDPQS